MPSGIRCYRNRPAIVTATPTNTPPDTDALLLRPDGYIAWAATGTDDSQSLGHALTITAGTPTSAT